MKPQLLSLRDFLAPNAFASARNGYIRRTPIINSMFPPKVPEAQNTAYAVAQGRTEWEIGDFPYSELDARICLGKVSGRTYLLVWVLA